MKRGFLKTGVSAKAQNVSSESPTKKHDSPNKVPAVKNCGPAPSIVNLKSESAGDAAGISTVLESLKLDGSTSHDHASLRGSNATGNVSNQSLPVPPKGSRSFILPVPPAQRGKGDVRLTKFGGTGPMTSFDTLILTRQENFKFIDEHTSSNSFLSSQLSLRNESFVKVMPVPGKGLGLVATQDCSPGDVLVQERPLIFNCRELPPHLVVNLCNILDQNMCAVRMEAFYKLYNGLVHSVEALSVIESNATGIELPEEVGELHQCVSELVSRANHSCIPNTVSKFNYDTFCIELYSVLPIKAGSEITVCYVDSLKPAKDRKKELKESWGFVCSCPACDISSPSFQEQEEARKFLRESSQNAASRAYRAEEVDSEDELKKITTAIDTTQLVRKRFEFLHIYCLAEQQQAFKTFNFQKASALAKCALEEVKQGRTPPPSKRIQAGLDTMIAASKTLKSEPSKASTGRSKKLGARLAKGKSLTPLKKRQIAEKMDKIQEAFVQKSSGPGAQAFMEGLRDIVGDPYNLGPLSSAEWDRLDELLTK